MDYVLPNSDVYIVDEMSRMVEDAIGTPNIPVHESQNDGVDASEDVAPGPTESTKNFMKLMHGANLPLYSGSKKHTALSFVVRLLQAKSLHGWTDNSFKDYR